VVLNGGVLSSTESGSIGGAVRAGSGPHSIVPGGALPPGEFGTLNLESLTTNSNTTLTFALGNPPVFRDVYSGSVINILPEGSLTVGASSTISFASNPQTPGDYRLFKGIFGSLALGNFNLPPSTSNLSYSLSTTADPGYLDLVASGSGSIAFWMGSNETGGANWSNSANWIPQAVPNGAGLKVLFGAAGTTQATINLDANETVGTISFTGSAGQSMTIAGTNSLTLDNGTGNDAAIVVTGTHTLSAPMVLNSNIGIMVTSSSDLFTLSGNVSGTGSLTVLGGGILTLTGLNTYSGITTVHGGTLQIPSGSLASPTQYVGYSGTGSFAQSGGTNSASNTLFLGYNAGDSGTYNLSDSGLLSAGLECIGYSGTGSFTQSGGTHSLSGYLYLGYDSVGSGIYNLSTSGLLSAPNEYIGYSGTGSFSQSGGSHSVSNLYLGNNTGGNGTYNLSGSGLLSSFYEEIGYSGTGSFMQSGGSHSVSNTLFLGYNAGGSGIYNLSGSGLLSAPNEYIGYSGTGSFSQSGGTHSVSGALVLAQFAGSSGTYNLSGGLLSLAGLIQGAGTATFNFGGGTLGANAPWSSSLNMNMSGMGGPGAVDTTGGNIGLSGNLTGMGGLTKIGAGTLTLAASNGYTGTTLVSGGTLLLANTAALSGSTFDTSGGGSLSFGTLSSATFGGLQGPGNLTLNNASVGAVSLSVGGNNASTAFSGRLGGSGSLTKIGVGMLTLNGNVALAGTATVNGGAINQSGGYLQPSTLVVDGGAYDLSGTGQVSTANEYVGYSGSGTFNQKGGTNTITNRLYLGTDAGASGTYNLFGGLLVVPSIFQGSGSSSLNIAGGTLTGLGSGVNLSLPIVLTSSGSSGTFDTSSSSLTLAGQISGPGGLTKTGSATLVLAGNNTYFGDTTVAQGALLLSNFHAAQNTTIAVGVNNGLLFSGGIGTFDVGAIGGSGGIALKDTGGHPITLVTGGNNANTTYSGVISGPGTLVHNGSGTLVLTGVNTYTGGTILGPDTLASVNPLAGTVIFSADATLQAAGLAFAINKGGVFINSNVTGSIDTANYNVLVNGPIDGPGGLCKVGLGTLTLAYSDDYSGDTCINQGVVLVKNSAALQNSTVSINVDNELQFSPGIGTFNVGGLSGSNSLTLNDTSGSPVTLDVGRNNANTTFSGNFTGEGTLVKEGSGSLALTGSSSFTGGVVEEPGTLSIGSDAALGDKTGFATWPPGGSLLKGNMIFAANSTLQVLGSFPLWPSRNIAINTGATATFDTQGYTLMIGGPISGAGGLTKTGSGTLVLFGSNTYTGGTTIAAGTLELDFSQAGAPSANIVNNAVNASSLTLGGGTLAIQGNISTANSQQFNGVTVNPGPSAIVLTTAGMSNPLLLSLGNISRSPGGTVDFTLPSGAPSATNGIATTTPNTSAGILGAYATVSGTDWACNNGSGNIVAYNAYTGGDLGSLGSGSALNVSPSGAQSNITSALSFNTLNLTYDEGVTMTGKGSLTLVAGGLIGNTSGAVSGGTVTGSASGELIVITPANLTIGSIIADNGGATALTKAGSAMLTLTGNNTYSGVTTIGAGALQLGNGGTIGTLGGGAVTNNSALVFDLSGASTFGGAISGFGSLTQACAGTLVLSATNTYGGTTIIGGGALQATDGVGLPTNSNLVLSGSLAQNGYGAVFQSSGAFSRTVGAGAGQVQWTGDGGFAANGGPLTVSMSPATPLVWNSLYNNNGTPGFLGDLNVLTFGSHTANGQVNFTDSIDLNGANQNGGNRQIDVAAGAGGDSAMISGNIIDSAGGGALTKTGAGTLILTGNNNYGGTTIIGGGALQATDGVGLPTYSNLVLSGSFAQNGYGAVFQSSGAFSRTVGYGPGLVQWTGDGGFAAYDGPLTVSLLPLQDVDGNTLSPASPLVWGNNSGTSTVAATQGFLGDGNVLTFGSHTANSQVNFQNSIDLNGENRQIDVAAGAGGDSATISGDIIDSQGRGGLLKTGAGALILSGNNTYSGGTTLSRGTLAVTNAYSLGASSGSLAIGPATLEVAGSFSDARNISLTDPGATIQVDPAFIYSNSGTLSGIGGLTLSGAGTLVLSGSNTYTGGTTIAAGTLTVTNSDAIAGGTSLTVGAGGTFVFDPSAAAAPAVASPAAATVPEPGTLALLAVGSLLVAVAVCRRRR